MIMSNNSNAMLRSIVALACLPWFALGCASNVEGGPVASQAKALSAGRAPSVPDALAVPKGNHLAFHADATGVQIYVCQADAPGNPAWVLRAPQADLFDAHRRKIGKHYAGPTWQALDGSTVVGTKLATYTDDPKSIPWLLLQAASNTGHGAMSAVTYVQRLDTHTGLAPSTGCDADHLDATAQIDYTATYYFYEATRAPHGGP
jgi:hypothetical protein